MNKAEKKINIKLILLVAAAVLIAADGIFLMFRFFSDKDDKVKSSRIIHSQALENTEFVADTDFCESFPANTSYAVDFACENNMNGYILNAYKTKDSKWVCADSDELKVLTGAEGKIKDHTYFEIIKSNLLIKGKEADNPVVPLLKELVGKCIDCGITPIINVRDTSDGKSLISELDGFLLSVGKLCFISEDYDFLLNLNLTHPEYTVYYTVDKLTYEEIDKAGMFKNGYLFFDAREEGDSEELIYDMKNKKMNFGIYDLNTEDGLELFSKFKPQVIITDKIVP